MLKHIVLLNGNSPEHFPKIFIDLANKRGLSAENIESHSCVISIGYSDNLSVEIISNNRALPIKDAAYLIKRTSQDTYRTYLIGQIIKSFGQIFADEANLLSDKTADKITMMVTLPLSGIAVPRSIIATSESYRANRQYVLDHVSFPAVVKKTGSKGKQVWKVESEAEMEERVFADDEMTLIQEYIPNDHDFRVFVLDGEVVSAIKRSSSDGFYNNVSQGGAAEKAEMTSEERNICIKATKVAKLRLAGVDLVRTPNGPMIFEVNKSPQLDIFNVAAGFDIEEFYSGKVLDELARLSK